jgi:hypothetical protein
VPFESPVNDWRVALIALVRKAVPEPQTSTGKMAHAAINELQDVLTSWPECQRFLEQRDDYPYDAYSHLMKPDYGRKRKKG